ncbi:MAG: M56 family metallopeptidase, partial [Acetatifactor sp.]|nr:M56 family metallopeptidase [Acetatifactor sp.]
RVRRTLREAVLWQDNIWFCDHVKSPFILGIFRPGIYLPSDIGQEQMDYVLAHERAHLKRKDHLWKALGYLLLAVYWFHPLVWVAFILLCRDIEVACDEKVIRNLDMSERKAYSRALLSCSQQRRMVIAYPLAFGEVGVKERVRSVLRYKKPAFWAAGAAIAACAVVAVCFLTNPEQQAEAASLPPIDQDGSETDSYVLSETQTQIPDSPVSQNTASPRVSTGYPGYDALIAEAQDALENFDPLTDERGDHFSGVIYINWDFETLGYILRDLDGNGVEELIFGENGEGGWDGIVYDLYTIVDGEVVHIFDGWERNRYYLCENGCIANESDGSAFEFSYAYYAYSGVELALIEAVIYNNESYAGDRDQRFYSTVYAGQLYEYEYEYGEKPAPEVYYEITSEKAEEIIAGYVYE